MQFTSSHFKLAVPIGSRNWDEVHSSISRVLDGKVNVQRLTRGADGNGAKALIIEVASSSELELAKAMIPEWKPAGTSKSVGPENLVVISYAGRMTSERIEPISSAAKVYGQLLKRIERLGSGEGQLLATFTEAASASAMINKGFVIVKGQTYYTRPFYPKGEMERGSELFPAYLVNLPPGTLSHHMNGLGEALKARSWNTRTVTDGSSRTCWAMIAFSSNEDREAAMKEEITFDGRTLAWKQAAGCFICNGSHRAAACPQKAPYVPASHFPSAKAPRVQGPSTITPGMTMAQAVSANLGQTPGVVITEKSGTDISSIVEKAVAKALEGQNKVVAELTEIVKGLMAEKTALKEQLEECRKQLAETKILQEQIEKLKEDVSALYTHNENALMDYNDATEGESSEGDHEMSIGTPVPKARVQPDRACKNQANSH